MNASATIDEMIREGVAPYLKKLGFLKQRHTWWRSFEEVAEVIDIEKSRWNSDSEACFAVNLGLYWPQVQKAINRESRSEVPKTPECTVSRRLGPLFNAGRDFWWRVGPDSDRSIAVDVCNKIQEFGIPWLRHGHEISNTLIYARQRAFTFVEKEILMELEKRIQAPDNARPDETASP